MTDRHQIAPYPVRLPAALRDQLEAAAASGSRSLHAEILARLAASFTADARSGVVDQMAEHRLQLKDHLIRDQMGRAHHLRVALIWLAQGIRNLAMLKRPDELPERARLLATAARTYADDYSASATAAHPAMNEELLEAQREFVEIEKKRAEVDHLFKTLPLAEAVKLDVPGLFPPDDVPLPAEAEQPDNPSPKLKQKRMTMRRKLKD